MLPQQDPHGGSGQAGHVHDRQQASAEPAVPRRRRRRGTREAWAGWSETSLIQQFNQLQRAAQILALLMCPAPDEHEEVVRCCLKPLGEPVLSHAVQDKLKQALPGWM